MEIRIDLGEAEDAVLVHWNYDQGSYVRQGEVIAEAMIEKVTVEVESPGDGWLDIQVQNGAAFRSGEILARLLDVPLRPADSAVPNAGHEAPVPTAFIPMAPAVRRYARERGVDLARLASFVGDRRMTREDIDAWLNERSARRFPYGPFRQAVISRLSNAKALPTTLQRPLHVECDRRAIVPTLLQGLAEVIPRHPAIHGWAYDDGIEPASELRLGLAVDTSEGLMVVVLHPDHGGWDGALIDLKHNVSGGHLRDLDRDRPSFVVSNLGPWGIEYFTPRLMAPTIAVLGVGQATGERLPVSLTFDHRALDGVEAARFLADLDENLGGGMSGL